MQSFKLTEADLAKIKNQQPLCLWMKGLSGAGKSTLANALDRLCSEKWSRAVYHGRSWWLNALGSQATTYELYYNHMKNDYFFPANEPFKKEK